ncbi:MAG: sigma-70 family RNA polymerase sigma factor [Planctomycetes bacterium]|nr:sigma-70 family RNA polymerase sigma factor [Planctomycetota bacterium]
MTEQDRGEATLLLRRIADGDAGARARLVELVYGELRRLAASQLRGARGETLQPTALVHEAWLRLADADAFSDRRHFFAVASKAMRSVLVDHVRAKRTQKRGGGEQASPLDETVAHLEAGETDLLDLNVALEELEREDPELARLVELRFFGGLSHEEVAAAEGTSLSTIERRWRLARAWLARRLGGGAPA